MSKEDPVIARDKDGLSTPQEAAEGVKYGNDSEEEYYVYPEGLMVKTVMQAEDHMLKLKNVPPGCGERWHTHRDDSEEIYYTLKGQGIIEWEDENGEAQKVVQEPGDAFYFPPGLKNRTVSNGETNWIFIAAVTNLPFDPDTDPAWQFSKTRDTEPPEGATEHISYRGVG